MADKLLYMSLSRWTHLLLTVSILLIAFWLRAHQLEQYPTGLHFDEAANAILSSEIAFDGYRPIFISSYTGKETLFFYAAGGIMRLIGSSIFSLRLTAAFLGLLTIAVTYRLGIAVFHDRRVALVAMVLLATNFSHLLFSRLGFRAISQPFMQALTILFLVQGIQHLDNYRRARYLFAAAGLFLGLTAHTYLAARLFPIALAIPLVALLIYYFNQRPKVADRLNLLLNLSLFGLIAAVVLAPLLYWFILNPDAFWVRIDQVGNAAGISTLEGLRRTTLMLFWDGDPYIRFNIPHRPLFFPLMVIPAVIGAWLLIFNQNNTKSADGVFFGRLILLIAPLIMLLPTALATSEIVPSNLRAIGIFPFIVFWPALGLVWLVERLLKIVTKSADFPVSFKHSFIPLYLLLLGMSAVNVSRDYFTVWGGRADSFYETEGDIREVASYLNTLESDRQIAVSTRFVPHPALAFLARDYDQLRLISESRAVIYPAGKAPLYIFPASSPENELTALFAGDREQFTSPSNIPSFTTLKLDQVFPKPQTTAFGNFGFAVQFVGYDFEPGQVGQSLTVRIYNEVLGKPAFNMIPFVHLEDHLGNRWSQLEQPGYSPADWQTGDRFVQQFELSLPAGLPPTNDYTLRIGWFDEATGQEVTRFDEYGQFAGSAFIIEDVAILANGLAKQVNEAPQPLNEQVADGLKVVGLEFGRRQFSQGDVLNFSIWWQADKPQANMKLITQLVQAGEMIQLESVDPAGDSYPFQSWETPSFVIDHHQIQLPTDLPPGEWELQTLAQFADQSTYALFPTIPLSIEPLDLIFEKPSFEIQVDAVFEDEIQLVGYTFDADGEELELIWKTVVKPAGDYVAFVQLLTSEQSCCVWQADRVLVSSAARPTSRWLVGEYLIDRYQVEGYQAEHTLVVGLYRPENGIRLITDEQADFVQLR